MLVPVPAIAPGLIVHVPVAGRPFNTTLPVGAAHEAGWVIVPDNRGCRCYRCSIDNHSGGCK